MEWESSLAALVAGYAAGFAASKVVAASKAIHAEYMRHGLRRIAPIAHLFITNDSAFLDIMLIQEAESRERARVAREVLLNWPPEGL